MQAVKRIFVWAIAAGAGLVLLWALFTREALRERYAAMEGWMGEEEQRVLRDLFGLKGPELTHPDLPEFALRPADGDTCFTRFPDSRWHVQQFVNEGSAVPVRVRRLRTQRGGYLVRMPKDAPYESMERVVLLPADLASIRDKYMQVLAAELGLFAPELGLVRLSACGVDQGIFITEERPDAGALEKLHLAECMPFEQGALVDRPDHAFPDVQDSTTGVLLNCLQHALIEEEAVLSEVMAPRQAAALLLLMVADERYDLMSMASPLAYDRATGEVLPLWRARRADAHEMPTGMRAQFLTLAWTSEPVRAALDALMQKPALAPDTLRQLWRSVDETWLPSLSGGALDHARGIADAWKEEALARMDRTHIGAVLSSMKPLAPPPAIGSSTACAQQRWVPRAELASIAQRLGAAVEGDTLVFHRDRYVIEEDVVLPPGIAVRMGRSTRLFLGAGRSLFIQGPLKVQGTLANPVFIRPLDERQPFGTVAVLGGKDVPVRCEVNGLRMSGGSGAVVAGITFTGMLAFHRADVSMTNCEIQGSRGEDAVNVKRGRVEVRDCRFSNGHADLIDLDQVTGTVIGCVFSEGRSDDNGDGLDLSGSRVLVQDCRFERLLDKGVSVGESSEVLITECTFQACGLAIAVKDGSTAHVGSNNFLSCPRVFAVYRKKPVWPGGTLVKYPNQLRDHRTELDVDALSNVQEMEHPDSALWRGFGMVFKETKGRSKRDRADAPSPSRRNREAAFPPVAPAPADTTQRRAL